MRRGLLLFYLPALLVLHMGAGLHAETAIEESLRLEAQGAALLLEHYQVEQIMLAPDPDRLTVFLTIPPGSPIQLEEAVLFLDDKAVHKHRYTANELALLDDGAVQPLFIGQQAIGEHLLRIELRTKLGKVQPMGNYSFSKQASPRFIELQIVGTVGRQIKVAAW